MELGRSLQKQYAIFSIMSLSASSHFERKSISMFFFSTLYGAFTSPFRASEIPFFPKLTQRQFTEKKQLYIK